MRGLPRSLRGSGNSGPLKLTPAAGGDVKDVADDEAAADDGSDGVALGLGVAGAVVGLTALVVALLAYRRSTPAS